MAKLLEITGKAISGEWGQDDDTGTGIPVLRTTNFTNEGFVNYKNVVTRSISKKNIAEKYLRHGDVIIEKSGGSDKQPVGRVIFFEGEENKYLFNNFTGLLRVQNPEEWLPKYVFYALYAYYRNGGTRAFENRTTGLHNLQVDNYVKSVDIPKLSYRKQQHICETLDHLRDAVAYRERQLTKLDELIKARFVEMFGDPVINEAKWPIERLEKHLTIIGGYAFKSDGFKTEGIPVLRIGNINSGHFLPTNMVYWHNDPTLERYKIHPGDLVISLTGTVGKNDYGNVCILGNSYNSYYLNQRNAKLELKETLNSMYLSELLKFPKIKSHLTGISRGIRQANISNKDILSLPISIPPLSLQNQFADFVAEVDKSKVEVQKALDQTQLLFDSLMQQYFG